MQGRRRLKNYRSRLKLRRLNFQITPSHSLKTTRAGGEDFDKGSPGSFRGDRTPGLQVPDQRDQDCHSSQTKRLLEILVAVEYQSTDCILRKEKPRHTGRKCRGNRRNQLGYCHSSECILPHLTNKRL